jgi:hypothetical protein
MADQATAADTKAEPGYTEHACWARVEEVTASIARLEGDLDSLRDERSECFQALLDLGVPRAAVAARAGMTSMAVKFDLSKYPRVAPGS